MWSFYMVILRYPYLLQCSPSLNLLAFVINIVTSSVFLQDTRNAKIVTPSGGRQTISGGNLSYQCMTAASKCITLFPLSQYLKCLLFVAGNSPGFDESGLKTSIKVSRDNDTKHSNSNRQISTVSNYHSSQPQPTPLQNSIKPLQKPRLRFRIQ